MAIIYTYPRVTDPDGTELIVVSETKNQNATRLMSVGDICSFCTTPSGETGCENVFAHIKTSSVVTANALGCDTTLTLHGAGGTVVTNTGLDVYITSSPVSTSCPTTYVIKPVTCAGDTCVTSIIESEWIYTCDETLGAGSPKYINNLIITGVPIDSESGCWYIEEFWVTADDTLCSSCCTTPSTEYKLHPCYPGTTYYTTELLGPGIGAKVGDVIIATTPEGEHCYTVTEESGAPIVAITVGTTQDSGCTTDKCIELENILLTPCPGNDVAHNVNIVTNSTESPTIAAIDDGVMISITTATPAACYTITKPSTLSLINGPVTLDLNYGDPSPACECCTSTLRKYLACEDPYAPYIFNLDSYGFAPTDNPTCLKAEITTGIYTCLTFDSCVSDGAETIPLTLVECDPDCSDTDCAGDPGTIRYKQCGIGDPPGVMDTYVYFFDTGSMPSHIVVTYDDGVGTITNWCYLQDPLDSQPENPFYSYVVKDPLNCDPCEVYEYFDCLDPATRLFTNNADILNIVSPMTFTTIEGSSTCYETLGPVGLPEPGIVINEITLTQSFEDCDCCAEGVYANVHEYNLCPTYDPVPPGALPFIGVDLTGYIPLGSHPQVISVDVGLGQDICYEYNNPICVAATYTLISSYDDCSECTEANLYEPVIQLLPCDGGSLQSVLLSDLTTGGSAITTVGDVINVSAGPLSALNTCWEVQDMNVAGPPSLSGNNDYDIVAATGGLTACECCVANMLQYDVCVPNTTCGLPTAFLYLDGNAVGFPAIPPAFITAEDSITLAQCCYELVGSVACDTTSTGTYVATLADCATCNP